MKFQRSLFTLVISIVIIGLRYYLMYHSSISSFAPRTVGIAPSMPATSITLGVHSKTTGCQAHGALPDSACTPGAIDARVTQQTIQSTICVQGYTKTVRPPVSYTDQVKKERMDAYSYQDSPKNYELDHLIPLELGGAPSSVDNLWPEAAQPAPGFHEKDSLENYLHAQVCNGAMTLSQAQSDIANNWLQTYAHMGQ